MTITAAEANEFLIHAVAHLRDQLFEPTDYGIIELVDIMLLNVEQGIPELTEGDLIERQEVIEFTLNTGLQAIYRTIGDLRPGHFKGDTWRWDCQGMISEG